ncbi:MAG: repressor protein [Rhizobium sp.]|nr:repressor protein [Rhizobium sp.]
MNKLQEIVAKRLEELNLGPVEAAVAGGLERTYIRDLVKEKKQTVNADKMPKLARALKLDPEALARNEAIPMDTAVKTATQVSVPNASFPPIYQKFPGDVSVPLRGQTAGGPNGRFVFNGDDSIRVICPPGLENVPEAYAVRVHGTSMEPRFKAGETVWLNPREPYRAGDDVVVQVMPEEEGQPPESYIKEFRSRSSSVLRLFQHNPDEGETKELQFDDTRVFSIHKVVHHAMV